MGTQDELERYNEALAEKAAYEDACEERDWRALTDERDELRAENERLREALRPFVAFGERVLSGHVRLPDSVGVATHSNNVDGDVCITIGHLRAALALSTPPAREEVVVVGTELVPGDLVMAYLCHNDKDGWSELVTPRRVDHVSHGSVWFESGRMRLDRLDDTYTFRIRVPRPVASTGQTADVRCDELRKGDRLKAWRDDDGVWVAIRPDRIVKGMYRVWLPRPKEDIDG